MSRSFVFGATMAATVAAATVACAAVAVPSTAEAQSRLNFSGSVQLMNEPGSGGANLLLDFLFGTPEPTLMGTPTGTVTVVPTTNGVFLPEIGAGMEGTLQDVVMSASGVVGRPIGAFLTLGGYTFTLADTPQGNAFGPISLYEVGDGTAATFGVHGTVTGGDFGATPTQYMGIFTAQFSGRSPSEVFGTINAGGSLPVAFSAEFITASVVPEPSTYALLATGLAGVALVARRRRSRR